MSAEAAEVEYTIQSAVQEWQATLGARLAAVYSIGSGFAKGARSGQGRLLVLVDRVDRALLDGLVGLVTKCQGAGIRIRLDTADNLIRGADTAPAFTLELKDTRQLLAGQDVLASLEVHTAHLRLHVEQGLRGMHRDLVQNYLDHDIRGYQIPELRKMSRKLVYLLEGMLICAGVALPSPPAPEAILETVRTQLLPQANPQIWSTVQAFARNELPPGPEGAAQVYACLFEALPLIIDVVDRMATPAA